MKKIVVPGLVAGLLMMVIAIVVGYVFNFVFPSLQVEYENATMFRPWDDPVMYVWFVQPFFLAFVLAWIWDKVKLLFAGTLASRVFYFALFYWMVAIIPGMLMSISTFKISILMTLTWTLSSLIQAWVAACIIIRMNR
jgi:hypothetical protein